jgi:hypothetical protein
MRANQVSFFWLTAVIGVGIGVSIAQERYGFSSALDAIRETVDQRDATGAVRAAVVQVETAAQEVNALATAAVLGPDYFDSQSNEVASRVDASQKAITAAIAHLEKAEWTIDGDAFPWQVLLTWVPDDIVERRDLSILSQWLRNNLQRAQIGLDQWGNGSAPSQTIFAVQSELNRALEVLSRASGAIDRPELPNIEVQ